jgi:hypothetical protein
LLINHDGLDLTRIVAPAAITAASMAMTTVPQRVAILVLRDLFAMPVPP